MNKHLFLSVLLGSTLLAQVASGAVLKDIRVEGTRRIETATVMTYLNMKTGDDITPKDLDAATKTLFATGLFSDVDISFDDGTAIIHVVENPIIYTISFEGNDDLDSDILKTEVLLKPRMVFTQRKLQNDVERLQEIYKRNGRFTAQITPKIIEKDQNRVNIVFQIKEGEKALVKKIVIHGNNAFSDDILKEKLITKESAWYRFLASTDTYDPDRLNYDKELLRRFYLQEGYADIAIKKATADMAEDKENFIITFEVEEGKKYHFSEPSLKVSLPEYQQDETLQQLISFQAGDTFNTNEVEDTIDALTDALANKGYAFVDIKHNKQKDEKTQTISLVFNVTEGEKVFINRIHITGNSRTLDKVIRREFRSNEGDAFHAAKLRRSRQRIENLDYFSRVELSTQPVIGDDSKVDVALDLAEKSTGAFNIGVGWSSYDGLMFETGIQERNILGTGNIVGINALISERETQYAIGLTNPYFMDKNLLAGVDVFRTTRDNEDSSSYSYETVGGSVRFGWDYTDRVRHSVRYTLREDNITDIETDSIYIREQEGRNLVSLIGQEISYDKRDSRINPTQGYYTSLGLDLAGIGGDSKFVRVNLTGIRYYPVMEEVVLSLRADAGHIWGLGGQDVRINDRYFLGDASLRGFEYGGVGARDKATDDALGGNWYLTGSAEVSFPIGLPKELGIKGKLFTDAGFIGKPNNYDPATMDYSGKMRIAAGTGILWQSPMGMINLDFSWPILKEKHDKTQVFRLNFGKGF